MDLITKDPNNVEPYGMDWTAWLAGLIDTDGDDTIADSAWTVTGPDTDLTYADDSIVTGSLKTQVRLAGGTVGKRYTLTNRITTASGAIADWSVLVLIKEQ